MIAGFFTWSENITITRFFKVVGRNGVLLVIIYYYYHLKGKGFVDYFRLENKPALYLYVAYLLLGLVSVSWSTDPFYSGLQWFMITQSLVFCYFFMRTLNLLEMYYPEKSVRLSKLLGNSIFILILIFIVGMYVAPDVFLRLTLGGTEARLGGYMMNPNELGMLAGVGVACYIYELSLNKSTKWANMLKLLILFWALYATGSRSSLIGALLIVLFYVLQSNQKRVKVVLIIAMILVAPPAIYFIILKGGDPERMEELMSMTGRLPFWKALITEGLPREPLFGFGFMRIDYNDFFQSTHTYPGKMTHNTFIQVLMNLGFVGLIIVLVQVIYSVGKFMKAEKSKQLLLIGIFIPILINSFTEFGIYGESNYGILFYQLSIMLISFVPREFLTQKEKLSLNRFKARNFSSYSPLVP